MARGPADAVTAHGGPAPRCCAVTGRLGPTRWSSVWIRAARS